MTKIEDSFLEEQKSEQEENASVSPSKGSKDSKKKTSPFQCKCGKSYGSLAAVHTHINNKHNQKESINKEYKAAIINPKKNGQGQTTSVRMKDIKYDQQEADLMCHVDNTLKDIYTYWQKEIRLTNAKEKLIKEEDYIDSQSDLQENEENYVSKRDVRIKSKLADKKKTYGIEEIDQIIKNMTEFQPKKFFKFNLSMKPELAKFFQENVAIDIILTLEMIGARKKDISSQLRNRLQSVEGDLWKDMQKMREMLQTYYCEWKKKVQSPPKKIKNKQ